MDNFLKTKLNQKGIALISALVTIGIISAITSYLFLHHEIQKKIGLQQRDRFDYSQVKILGESFAESRSLLYEAILNTNINDELRNCMTDDTAVGLPSTPCIADTEHPIQFGLHLPSINWLPITNLGQGNQAKFNRMGQLCINNVMSLESVPYMSAVNSSDPSCSSKTFKFNASFVATCASFASSCEIASTIKVSLRILPSSNLFSPVTVEKEISFQKKDGGNYITRPSRDLAEIENTRKEEEAKPSPPPSAPPPPPPPPPKYRSCGAGMAGNSQGGCSRLIL